MSRPTAWAVLLPAIAMFVGTGCRHRQPGTSGLSADELLLQLSNSDDHATRFGLARELAALSPDRLQGVLPTLQAAVAKERDPLVRPLLEQAIYKARKTAAPQK